MAATLLLLLAPTTPTAAQTVAIVGGTVHPVSGPPIENGVVVITAGRIAAVGPAGSVNVPDGARRVDARGMVVTPGLIDVATQVGLLEVSSVSDTRDGSLDADDPVRAAFRVIDGINPQSIVIPETRLGGVTTVGTLPAGGIIAGQGAVIDLAGSLLDDLLVSGTAVMVAAFDREATFAGGGARGGIALRLREVLEDARVFQRNRAAYQTRALRTLAASRLDLAALEPVLAGELPLLVEASRASDIDAALRIAQGFGIRLILLDAEEAWMRADLLASADVPVVVKPLSNLPVQFDRLGSRFDNAALLDAAGVTVVISTRDTHNARNLRFEAGNAVRHGLDWSTALRAVTLHPARMLHLDGTRGSLEPGKAGNVVVWSGDPFEFATAPVHVFIRGNEVAAMSRQRLLLERYRVLDGEPVQYRR